MMDGHRGRPTQGDDAGDPSASPNFRRRRASWNANLWNPAKWNPGSWAPAPSSIESNRGYRPPGSPGGRRFAPTEHLAPEAVAAFVDGELAMNAHIRATHHLAMCVECVAAVDAQTTARARLRESGQVVIPDSLLSELAQIPTREIDMTAHEATSDRLRGSDLTPPETQPATPMTRGRMNRRWGR